MLENHPYGCILAIKYFKRSLKFYVLLICGSKDALNNYKNIWNGFFDVNNTMVNSKIQVLP